jgi:DNA-directed RNA polymerase specialized sigma24 family protein
MDHDSNKLPKTQIFSLKHAVVFVCSPEPEPVEPEPDPPRHAYDPDGVMALMSLTPHVEHVLRRVGVRADDVPDLRQMVLLELLLWWAKRGPSASPAAWREARAFTALVTQRTACDHHRQRRRRARREQTGWAGEPSSSLEERAGMDIALELSPEDAVLAAEAHRELASELSLDELAAATTPAFWRAFYAHFVLNVPVTEIAESEHVPTGTIYTRLRLAREDLRTAIRRHRARKRR